MSDNPYRRALTYLIESVGHSQARGQAFADKHPDDLVHASMARACEEILKLITRELDSADTIERAAKRAGDAEISEEQAIAAMAIAKCPNRMPGVAINGGPLLTALEKIVFLKKPKDQ